MINTAVRFPEYDAVIADAYKAMNATSVSTNDICIKLREMSQRTRICCDMLDHIIDVSLDFRTISRTLVEKVIATAGGMNSSIQGSCNESGCIPGFTRFMEDNLDHACNLYESNLEEIYEQIEELSCLQTDMDGLYSDLEGCNEEYRDIIRLMMEHLLQNRYGRLNVGE